MQARLHERSRPRHTTRALRFALAVMGTGLVACGRAELDDQLARYREEVARIVGAERAAPEPQSPSARLPGRRHRRLEPADLRMNVFDFLSIKGCELSRLVGERNSALGRQMVPSRRLIYELEVLEAADGCLPSLSEARAAKLGKMIARKHEELPLHVWNAVWLGEEMEAYLASTPHPFAIRAGHDGTAAVRKATEILAAGVESAEQARRLEDALGALLRADPTGPSLRGLDAITRELDAVSRMIHGRAPAKCRGDSVRLRSVFEQAYLPIQAHLAEVHRDAQARIESLDGLFEQSRAIGPAPSPEMLAYHGERLDPDARGGLWQRYREAVLRHVDAWEPTLRACGLIPDGGSA